MLQDACLRSIRFGIEKVAPYLKDADVKGYHAHGYAYDGAENQENILAAQSPILSEMVFETQSEMQDIFSQIDQDIDQIRAQIENPLSIPMHAASA